MSIPAYKQIKDVLTEEIRQGKYKPGAVIPSVNRLSEMFGTSRNTAVKAVSDLVHEGIVYTVQGKGTLVRDLKNPKAVLHKRKENSTVPNVGILLADFDNIDHPYMSSIIKGVYERAKAIQCNMKIFCINNYSIDDFIHHENFDGLIVLTVLPYSSVFILKQNKIPFVLANNDIYGEDIYSVTVDIFAATCEAIRYLYNLGHRDICVMAGPHHARSTSISYTAYKHIMAELDIEVNEAFFKSCDYGVNGGYEAFLNLMQTGNVPTAVFALEDYIACGVIKAAAQNGLAVPKDLSVIGNGDMLNSSQDYSLTTFDAQLSELGGCCLELLDKQLKNEPVKKNKVSLRSKLVERATCSKK